MALWEVWKCDMVQKGVGKKRMVDIWHWPKLPMNSNLSRVWHFICDMGIQIFWFIDLYIYWSIYSSISLVAHANAMHLFVYICSYLHKQNIHWTPPLKSQIISNLKYSTSFGPNDFSVRDSLTLRFLKPHLRRLAMQGSCMTLQKSSLAACPQEKVSFPASR